MSTQNIASLDGSSYEAVHSSVSQNIFSYLKMFFHISEKLLQLRISKKRMNITDFINMQMHIYIPILYMTKMTQNKNDSINSCC